MTSSHDKFRGCILGAVLGDVAGAVVEAESPGFIAKTFASVGDILATDTVPEFQGPPWQVGRFTDDTQMMLCVAEWLLEDDSHSPEILLSRFARAYEPWRRYGTGTEAIFRAYSQHPRAWRELSTVMFSAGSYGNGSAMRVAPVGLAYANDLRALISLAMESSRTTHSHSNAYQACVLQSLAVAIATKTSAFSPDMFLSPLRAGLAHFADLLQDTTRFACALDIVEQGLRAGLPCIEMASMLGTGVAAYESVPMALYCFLRHPESYERVIHEAIFIGGDTDTIASMAGAISGAFLGRQAIPAQWLGAIREQPYSPSAIEALADRLWAKFGSK